MADRPEGSIERPRAWGSSTQGREAEIAVLERLLAGGAEGCGLRAVVLGAAPGMDDGELLSAVLSRPGQPAPVLRARAVATEADLPYVVLGDVLAQLPDTHGPRGAPGTSATRAGGGAAAVAALGRSTALRRRTREGRRRRRPSGGAIPRNRVRGWRPELAEAVSTQPQNARLPGRAHSRFAHVCCGDRMRSWPTVILYARATEDRAVHDHRAIAQELLRVLSGPLRPDEAASLTLEVVARGLGLDTGALWLVDVEHGFLYCTRVWQQPGAVTAAAPVPGRTLTPGEGLAGQVWAAGKPQRAPARAGDSTGPGGSGATAAVETSLAFPLLSGSQVIGVIELSGSRSGAGDEAELGTMGELGAGIGGVLQRIADEDGRQQLLDRLRLAERRQRFLADVSQAMAGSADGDAMLQLMADLAVPLIGDACMVHLVADDGSVRTAAARFADAEKGTLSGTIRRRYPPSVDGDAGIARVLTAGTSVFHPQVTDALLAAMAHDDDDPLAMLRAMDVTSLMVVPLPGRGRTLGSMMFSLIGTDRSYGSDELALVEELGRRVGLAVTNARLHERERTVAAALQRSLLPPDLPRVPSVELAASFHPGGEGVSVGGDFYDVFAIGEGAWVVGIGDVCGVGPEAAAMTAQVRYSARALASPHEGPATLMKRVNRLLVEPCFESRFCTAVYGMLRPTADGITITLASAGHPPPLLLRSSGRVEAVGGAGTLLGVVDDPEQLEEEVTMAAGDLLLLYTDGVIEARREDEWFGEDRLRELLEGCGGMDAAGVTARVQQAVVEFAGGAVGDDVATLAVKVTPQARA